MDPLQYLFSLEHFGIKFGLGNISALVARLGHPERRFRSVHVAGTNGKGSVTAMVDAALRAAGHRSARYTSPHLVDLAERFVIDGRPVERDALLAAVADVRDAIESLRADGSLEVQPTFFEVTTAVAFELFRRAGVEIAVIEVGLGGRLDATNVARAAGPGRDGDYLDRARSRAVPRPHAARTSPSRRPASSSPAFRSCSDRSRLTRRRSSSGSRASAARRSSRTTAADAGGFAIHLAGAHQRSNAASPSASWRSSTRAAFVSQLMRSAPGSPIRSGPAGSTPAGWPMAASCCSTPLTTRPALPRSRPIC